MASQRENLSELTYLTVNPMVVSRTGAGKRVLKVWLETTRPDVFEKERTENVTPCSDLNQLLWKMLAFSFKSTEERNVDNADDKLVEIIRRSLVDGKLPCGVAFRIAEELDVSVRKVGKAANDMKIKISHCQLGCF